MSSLFFCSNPNDFRAELHVQNNMHLLAKAGPSGGAAEEGFRIYEDDQPLVEGIFGANSSYLFHAKKDRIYRIEGVARWPNEPWKLSQVIVETTDSKATFR